MYAFWFLISYFFVKKWGRLTLRELDTLLLSVFIWVVLGGRIGYILFYNFEYYFEHPTKILSLWEWGMSFHGWLIWVIAAVFFYAKKYKKSFFSITDSLAIIVPVAIGLWRIGNYINGELPGYTPYDWPFGMVKNGIAHFPSPLFEMLLEGIFLFLIMLFFAWKRSYFHEEKSKHKNNATWFLSALFLIVYAIFRLIAEQFRLPDSHIGYLFGTDWITIGIIYTLPILIVGMVIIFLRRRKN